MRHELLKQVKRVVVKVGTKLLVNETGRLDVERIAHLADELKWLFESGREILLVTSGAIVAGLEALGLSRRPKDLPKLQAAAAIGQGKLMHLYQEAFTQRGVRIAQVLLTAEDLKERKRHLNAKNTLEALLSERVLPIVNENDTVATEEIKFGDNDQLSALVSNLIQADLLMLLTDQDGFLRGGEVIPNVFKIDEELESLAHHAKDWKGIGGMKSKLEAAKIMMRSGELMMIANGFKKDIFQQIFSGGKDGFLNEGRCETGTLFIPRNGKMSGRKRWIAHFLKPQGTLVIDDGAVAAICEKGKSLLAPGILRVEGKFSSGQTVRLCDLHQHEVARGLVNYSSEDLKTVVTRRDEGLAIHRDNLVIL